MSNKESKNMTITGGVVRLDFKGVYLCADETHRSIGIKKVYIDKEGKLVIVKDLKDAVVTTSVTPDETLTEKGVTVGLSGGQEVSKISFYLNGVPLNLGIKSDYDKIADKFANIWFLSITHK